MTCSWDVSLAALMGGETQSSILTLTAASAFSKITQIAKKCVPIGLFCRLCLKYAFQFFPQPVIQAPVPVEMGAKFPAATRGGRALGHLPLLLAVGASGGGLEGVPSMATFTPPVLTAVVRPITFWALNLYIFCHAS